MYFSDIIDLYYLEAIKALPVRIGNKAQEKIADSAERLQDIVIERTAETFCNYLILASAGEARHAHNYCEYIIDKLDGHNLDRSDASKYATNFDRDKLVTMLLEVFEQDWPGGYGGEAWYTIIYTVQMYLSGELSPMAFVDRCIDLEHNGGNVFDKDQALRMAGIELDVSPSSWEVTKFFDFKRDKDILRDVLHETNSRWNQELERFVEDTQPIEYIYEHLSKTVARLIGKVYMSHFGTDAPDWTQLAQKDFSYAPAKEVLWGTVEPELLASNVTYCDNCEEQYSGEYCESCYAYCNECDSEVASGYMMYDYDMCEPCFLDKHTTCENCGEYISNDEINEVTSEHVSWPMQYCDDCLHDNHVCDGCLELVDKSTVIVKSSPFYCNTCQKDHPHQLSWFDVLWNTKEYIAARDFANTINTCNINIYEAVREN